MNYRESLFPSRRETTAFGSQSVKRGDSGRRQSSIPQFSHRSGSVVTAIGLAKSDPRPIRNADFIRACSAKVENFIRKIAPNASLSPKAFISPTSRDFAVLWETLLHAFDSKWYKRIKGKKLEDQFSTVFKGLGYVSSISKSALSAPGSTHSWPQIVLALDWMVDIIYLKHKSEDQSRKPLDAMEMDDAKEDVLQMDLNKLFAWMTESYEKYMSFDDGAVKEIDQSLISEIHKSQEQQKRSNQEKQSELAAVEAEYTKMQQTPSPLTKMKSDLESMHQDEQAFNSKIRQIEESINRLKKKGIELETEVQNKRAQIEGLDREIAELRERVSKQSVNKEDIARLLNEREKLQQMLDNALTHKTAVEQEVNGREVQKDGLLNQLEKCVHQYNTQARKLKLIPSTSKYAMGTDFSVHIHRNAAQIQELCSADNRGVIHPGLQRVEQTLAEITVNLKEQLVQMQQDHHQLQNEIAKLQNQHKNCMLEIEKVEKETTVRIQTTRDVQKEGANRTSRIQTEIQNLHMAREDMIRSVEQNLPKAEAHYRETVSRCNQEQQELVAKMNGVIDQVRSTQSGYAAMMDRLNLTLDNALQSVPGNDREHNVQHLPYGKSLTGGR